MILKSEQQSNNSRGRQREMKIRWLDEIDLTVVTDFDEKNEIADEGFEIVEKGEVNEVDILDDSGEAVDMQFGNGSVAFGVSKECFTVIEK